MASVPSFIAFIREVCSIVGLAGVVIYQDLYFGVFSLVFLPLFIVPTNSSWKKGEKIQQKRAGHYRRYFISS